MYCEFCQLNLTDSGEARRHIITVAHMRQRRNLDLSKASMIHRIKQAYRTPKNLIEVCETMNAQTSKDFDHLNEAGFFTVVNDDMSALVKEFADTLYQTATDFYINNLPNELREPLLKAFENYKKVRSAL